MAIWFGFVRSNCGSRRGFVWYESALVPGLGSFGRIHTRFEALSLVPTEDRGNEDSSERFLKESRQFVESHKLARSNSSEMISRNVKEPTPVRA